MLLGTFVYIGMFFLIAAQSASEDAYQSASDDGSGAFWGIILGWNVLLLVVMILVIIDSVRKVRAGKTRELGTGVFAAKLAAIPFFLINFAIWGLAAFGGTVLLVKGIGIAILAAVAVATVLTYLAMISTSVYGWAAVASLRRERRIGRALAVLYSILLCVFVADTLAGILLFAHSRRGRTAAPPEVVAHS